MRDRNRREQLMHEAMYGRRRQVLRNMLDDHEYLVYQALRDRPIDNTLKEKYETLVRLCDVKRSYEVPPEYSGLLNIEKRISWSPTDTEIARILVSITIADSESAVLYSDLVSRIDTIVSTARPHIYRSLKVILREIPQRGGSIKGVRLK